MLKSNNFLRSQLDSVITSYNPIEKFNLLPPWGAKKKGKKNLFFFFPTLAEVMTYESVFSIQYGKRKSLTDQSREHKYRS